MQRIVFQNQRICAIVCMNRRLKNLQKLSLGTKIRRSFIVRPMSILDMLELKRNVLHSVRKLHVWITCVNYMCE